MVESGTTIFTDPDDFQARLGRTRLNLVVTSRGDFKARLTWLKLRDLNLLRGSESLARIAYVSLTPARVQEPHPDRVAPARTVLRGILRNARTPHLMTRLICEGRDRFKHLCTRATRERTGDASIGRPNAI